MGDARIALSSGETVTFEVEVKPTGDRGWFGFSAQIEWKNAENMAFEHGIDRLCPGASRSLHPDGADRYPQTKDSLLPAVLLFLGWLFQRRSEQLSAADREAADKRAAIRETWTLMLPRSHSYAEKHYLPIQKTLREFFEEHDKWIAGSPNSAASRTKALFLKYLLFSKQLSCLREAVGGLFFKDRLGERVAAVALRLRNKGIDATFNHSDLITIIKNFDVGETLAQFEQKFIFQKQRNQDCRAFESAYEQFLNEALGLWWRRSPGSEKDPG